LEGNGIKTVLQGTEVKLGPAPYGVKESEYKSNEFANTTSLDPNPKNMRRKPI
jgi:hypothetical protein